MKSAIYAGTVFHRRFRPRAHNLRYRIFQCLFDIDEIDGISTRCRLFSRNRFNLFSFHDRDYGDRSGAPLRPQVEALMRRAEQEPDGGPIRLLTMPRMLGHVFNPLSVWFCHRRDGSLAISEIAARPPGAQITTLISRAHDWDAVGAWARLMVFDAIEPPAERKYAAGAAYLRGQGQGRVKAVHGLDVVQRELGHLVTDARVPKPGQPKAASYEGEGFVVVRHPETAVVADALKRIVATVRVELAE